jgi:hypothetical protein
VRGLPVQLDEFKVLKRAILNDAVTDWWGLWEVAGLTRTRFPRLAADEQLVVAGAAVRELLEAGLLTKLSCGTWLGQEHDPVPEAEYESVLSDSGSWNPSPDPIFWVAAEEPHETASWQSILDSL